MVSLPVFQIEEICRLGSGSMQCRYLGWKQLSASRQYYCLKLITEIGKVIDEEVKAFHDRQDKSPVKSVHYAAGNNCAGYMFSFAMGS